MTPVARQGLAEVLRLGAAGDWPAARAAAARLTVAYPDWAAAWHVAAFAAWRSRDPAACLAHCVRGLSIAPDEPRLVLQRGLALMDLGRVVEAREAGLAALASQSADPRYYDQVGGLLHRAQAHAAALEAYDRAVELAPGDAHCLYNRAAVRRFIGEFSLAEQDYDRVIALRPDDYEAYKNRSDLRTQSSAHNHVQELERVIASGVADWRGEVQVRYALAKEYEDLGDHDCSWHHLTVGATCRRRHLSYDVSTDVATVEWIIAAFPDRPPPPPVAASGADPIFIVGLPRSGSTLVERILSSHSAVVSCGELNDWALALVEAVGARDGAVARSRRALVEASAGIDFAALGHDYLRRVALLGHGDARFIDKMPLNYLYCGLIRRALPMARIVHVQRHPVAACYAMYKMLFQDGYPFSYDLDDLADYYIAYRRLMAHWAVTLPGSIHTVRYEALVDDQQGETQRLLAACGLPYEEACIEFHTNPAPSTTASASQVRRPLYRSSLDQWRHYTEGLAPLLRRLAQAGIDLDGSAPR